MMIKFIPAIVDAKFILLIPACFVNIIVTSAVIPSLCLMSQNTVSFFAPSTVFVDDDVERHETLALAMLAGGMQTTSST